MKPSEHLNTIVGENNVGKSALFAALAKLIAVIWGKQNPANLFKLTDLRFNQPDSHLSVGCIFALDTNDRRDLIDELSPEEFDRDTKRTTCKILGNTFNTLEVVLEWSLSSTNRCIKLGPLFVDDSTLSYEQYGTGSTLPLNNLMSKLATTKDSGSFNELAREAKLWSADNLLTRILSVITPAFDYFSEYRARPCKNERSPALYSLEGSQTANVLLNLKNHTDRRQRNRYIGVKHAFSTFFPNLKIEAVETSPGSGTADIQLTEIGSSYPVRIENVGAGVAELVTILTNLITFRRHIFVIEEPELHLHPHTKRGLEQLIRHSAIKNQVFTVTHDPVFINPDYINNLKRFYSLKRKKTGTIVASVSDGLDLKGIAQVKTAMRDVSKREIVFSRAILFVEDESQHNFIRGCAEKLDFGLDSIGLSIIAVEGKDGFKPYITLAEQLSLPFLCLADLAWGADKPEKIYRSLGCELEEYLDQAGFKSLMDRGRKAVGTSKQRVAKYCGAHIEAEDIPPMFVQLLEDATKLCKIKVPDYGNKKAKSNV